MPIVGRALNFNKKFLFQVRIDGFVSAAFSKCSELSADIAEVTYWEGGSMIPNKSLGRVTFKDITLERGAAQTDLDAYAWFAQTLNAPANVGVKDIATKRHLDIVQLDRDGAPLGVWTVINAFIKTFTASDWDNTSDDVAIEKLVLGYDFFVRVS